jgi:NAD(P)-dependent dehydrogenase (short-subunit alcohol dehydrogenase family)
MSAKTVKTVFVTGADRGIGFGVAREAIVEDASARAAGGRLELERLDLDLKEVP